MTEEALEAMFPWVIMAPLGFPEEINKTLQQRADWERKLPPCHKERLLVSGQ